jgi:hypothetical protein
LRPTRVKFGSICALYCFVIAGSFSPAAGANYKESEKAKFLAPCKMPDDFSKGDRKYWNLIRKKLFLTPGDYARVIMIPAFQPEMVLSVDAIVDPNGKAQFFITLTRPSANLFYTIPQPPATDSTGRPVPGATPYPLNKITIKKLTVPIDAALAAAIHETWVRMISRADIPPEDKPPLSGRIIAVDETVWFYSVKLPDARIKFAKLPLITTEMLERFRLIAGGFEAYCEDPPAKRARYRRWLLEDSARVNEQLAKQ